MIAVYCFYPGDQDLALKNAQWINELGGCKGHEVVVCYDLRCDPGIVEKIGVEMLKGFDKVWRLSATGQVDGWPQGANYFFRLAATWLANHPEWPHFMWTEPDAVPIKPGWLDTLESEYKRAGRPFMGERVDVTKEKPEVPVHMSGVGIYQNPIYNLAGEAYRAHDIAWDVAAKDQIVPNAHFTNLIRHYWKHGKFISISQLDREISKETVIFHASKDGSLIDLLRQQLRGETVEPIKILPDGFWVLAQDTIISDLVETTGRIDHDSLIPKILEHIKEGDTVIDVGAYIGDHTFAYSKAVGSKGVIHAFEPNPLAYKCLQNNMKTCGNVILHDIGLSDSHAVVPLNCDDGNYGSAYIGDGKQIAEIAVEAMETNIPWRANFIKIDVEGYELKVLHGAGNLINHCKPKMVIEINPVALARQEVTPDDIFAWLNEHQYEHTVIQDYRPEANWYDILCLPEKRPPGTTQIEGPPSTAPVAATLVVTKTTLKEHVAVLREFANSSPQNKSLVMQRLVYEGLKKPNPKNKKK